MASHELADPSNGLVKNSRSLKTRLIEEEVRHMATLSYSNNVRFLLISTSYVADGFAIWLIFIAHDYLMASFRLTVDMRTKFISKTRQVAVDREEFAEIGSILLVATSAVLGISHYVLYSLAGWRTPSGHAWLLGFIGVCSAALFINVFCDAHHADIVVARLQHRLRDKRAVRNNKVYVKASGQNR